MLRMFLLVFIGLLQRSYGDLPSLCSDGYLEVINGTETRFICSNFLGAQTIRWYFKGNTMATCSPLQSQNEQNCVVTYLPVVFTVSRTSPTTSVVTVKPIFKDKQSSLSCEITETKAISNCPVDLTYSATVSSCTVEFSGSTWTVSSQCNITKVYSSLARYRCDLYQRIQNDPEERRVNSSPMSTSSITEADYFSGYCSMTSFLPSEGTYSYRVMLIPGYVNVTPPFNGNNFIRIPKGYLSHNCPTSVSEYGNLQCACSVTDRGSPQGEIHWQKSSTNELSLNGVLRAQNGNILTCVLTWNRTEIQFLHYTIIVTYPLSDMQLKVNDIETVNATVKESSTVRMVCLADGRPTPSMRLISINKNTVLNTSPRGNVTVNDIRATVTYDIKSVQCQDTGEYECEVDTGPGQTHKRISLFVMCAPRQATEDFYSGTFNGGEARLEFKIIAYPPPDELSVVYIGPSLNDTTLRKMEYKNTVRFVCTYDNLLRYMVTCTVTLLNETINSTGVYHAVFSNALGNISLTFEIKEHVDTPGKSKAEVAGPVAGGVVGAVIVIALVVSVVIFIIRRKRSGFDGGTGTTPAMTSKTDPQRNLETLYDQLQRGDMKESHKCMKSRLIGMKTQEEDDKERQSIRTAHFLSGSFFVLLLYFVNLEVHCSILE